MPRPELKGDRGPEIDNAVSRLGADATRNVILKGRRGMPAFPSIPEPLMKDLLAFLSKSEAAPVGSAAPPIAMAMAVFRVEPKLSAWSYTAAFPLQDRVRQ